MGVRVLLVDDDALVRAGLRMILSSTDDLDVVGEADDGSQAVDAIHRHRPDVVLMDIRMPGVDGIAATERIRAMPSPPAVIVLTTFDSEDDVLRALRAGASGFVLKDTPPDEIIRSVRLVAGGEASLSPSVTRTLLDHVGDDDASRRRVEAARERLDALTERELDVARSVGDGESNAEIGTSLLMSEATVKAHVSRILAKLDLTNRVQVAILVRDADLT